MVTLEELEKKVNAFIANSDEAARARLNNTYEDFKKRYQWQPAEPDIIPPTEVITRPTEGKILHDGWGANPDPDHWSVTNMKDNPALFKIVDKDKKNVATDFTTKEIAEQYIKWFVINENPDEAKPEEPKPGEEPGTKPVAGEGPYPGKGQMESTTRGPTVRHYAIREAR